MQHDEKSSGLVTAGDEVGPSVIEAGLCRLTAALAAAGPEDLPALASAHGAFEEIAALAAKSADGAPLVGAAERGARVIAAVILRECDDVAAALRSACEAASELGQILEGARPGAVQPPADDTAAAVAAHANDVSAEPTFGAEDLALVHDFVNEAREHLDHAEAELLKLERDPRDPEAVNAVFRAFHTIKGVAGFLNLRQIGALAHASENLLDLARQGSLEISGAVAGVVLEAADAMRSLVQGVDDSSRAGVALAPREGLPQLIDKLRTAATGGAATGGVVPTAVVESASRQERRTGDDRRRTDRTQNEPSAAEGTVKVSTDRLDSLINMVGELVIAESMVSQKVAAVASGNQRLVRDLGHLGKITRELQDLSMAMRMVPIQGAFQKMMRLVRDLAQKAGKEIELAVVGGETELDRNVVEAISDPLVHMVRNSVDHGIESPEDRRRAGKPPGGRIELRARHQAGSVVIEISDDGRGLNRAKILKKALQAGIVREGQDPSEQEVFRLIFHAGLSTAEKVTDVSGRGVGMDVVKRNIESLRGRIEIASVEGRGTTFTIRLPLTLAVIDGLLVGVGGERYVLPIVSVEQILRPREGQVTTVHGRGEMCTFRGRLLPLFRLHRPFNVAAATDDPAAAVVVVVRDHEDLCAVLVDEVVGQQQVVIKSLGEGVGRVRGVSGGAILGDGRVCLILDVAGVVELARSCGAAAAIAA